MFQLKPAALRPALRQALRAAQKSVTRAYEQADQDQKCYDRTEHRWRRLYRREKLENNLDLLRGALAEVQQARSELMEAERIIVSRALEITNQEAQR